MRIKSTGWLLIALALLLVMGAFAARRHVYRSTIYCIEAEASGQSMDDGKLAEWLGMQPGGVAHTVHIRRVEGRLQITFLQSRNLAGEPAYPNLEQAAASFGYNLRSARFEDCEKR
jgi:hypothetical protein